MTNHEIHKGLRAAQAETGAYNIFELVSDYPGKALRGILRAFGGDREATATAIAGVIMPVAEGEVVDEKDADKKK